MRAPKRCAADLIARIDGNVDDLYADRIDFATFDVRQRAAWDAIEEAGPAIKAHVLSVIRQRLPSRGPAR